MSLTPGRAAGLLLAITAIAGCGSHGAGANGTSATAAPVPHVALARVTTRTIHPTIVVPGAVAPLQTVALSNQINEPAAEVTVQEGDHVHAGQLLAQLDVDDLQASLVAAERTADADDARTSETSYSAQLVFAQAPEAVRQAQAQVSQARETLVEANRNLARDDKLTREGYLPQQNLDEQRVVVQTDQQSLHSALALLASDVASERVNGTPDTGLQASTVSSMRAQADAQRATAEQLRREIARATITSPIDGVVVNRNLNPGEYPAGRQIFTIEASATVYAVLTASAQQAYEIREGDRVAIERAGLTGPPFFGDVAAVLDPATPGATNYTVKVTVPNPRHALRAGTPVQGIVDLGGVGGAAVPASAFVDDARTTVAVVSQDRVSLRRVVEVATDGETSIVRGLPAGVDVVRSEASGLDDGTRVAVDR